ncbi:MAG: hypothetical protein WDA06_00520 [Phenylobacterium sp.]
MGKIDWGSIEGNNKYSSLNKTHPENKRTGSLAEYVKFTNGSSHAVRPLGKPYYYTQLGMQVDGRYRSVTVTDPNDFIELFKKYKGLRASEKYAVNVICREDNVIRILQGPDSIFKEFKSYYAHTQKNPGGQEGADFIIKATGDGKERRYETKFDKPTVLTPDEKVLVKNNLYDLEKIFKTVDDIKDAENRLLGNFNNNSEERSPNSDDDLDFDNNNAVEVTDDDLDF